MTQPGTPSTIARKNIYNKCPIKTKKRRPLISFSARKLQKQKTHIQHNIPNKDATEQKKNKKQNTKRDSRPFSLPPPSSPHQKSKKKK